MARVLGVDVGTTALKMGVYESSAEGETPVLIDFYSEPYSIRTYNNGLFSDVDPDLWKQAFRNGCASLSSDLKAVEVIGLSGTTPGLTALAADGTALYPAILMLDQRSRKQAGDIIERVGIETLLAETGNMPVAGGCSLASILWLKEHEPEVFNDAAVFGHSNTVMSLWLTGRAAIDPSSASLTALYNTGRNDLTWNGPIAQQMGVPQSKLPELLPSSETAGKVGAQLAAELGFGKRPEVVIGGNDAVVAAYSLGIENPGEVLNVNGTCEISLVCLPRCIPSSAYNVRAHVIPNRWLTLYVMNAGGKAFEWFRRLFCSEMSIDEYFSSFIPEALKNWLYRPSSVRYTPYLLGSRYSQDPLTAEFAGLTEETSRDEMAAALVRGLCEYQREHLREIALEVPLDKRTFVTGGAVNPAILEAKERWTRRAEYVAAEQSSMGGAALLGFKYLFHR